MVHLILCTSSSSGWASYGCWVPGWLSAGSGDLAATILLASCLQGSIQGVNMYPPVIVIQPCPNDSWVASRLGRGNPVSRPKTTEGQIYLTYVQGHCILLEWRPGREHFHISMAVVNWSCLSILAVPYPLCLCTHDPAAPRLIPTPQAHRQFLRLISRAATAWHLQTTPRWMLGNHCIFVEAKRGLGSANFLSRSVSHPMEIVNGTSDISHGYPCRSCSAVPACHDLDHPELIPMANFSQTARHTAASVPQEPHLSACHQHRDWIDSCLQGQ